MYSSTVIEHFISPRNVGELADANGIGSIGDPGCGDQCLIFIKVSEDIIEDISYLIFGCGAAVATGSMTTELAKGKTLSEALNLKEEHIIKALGGLPDMKEHCSNLGVAALRKAIADYLERQGRTIDEFSK